LLFRSIVLVIEFHKVRRRGRYLTLPCVAFGVHRLSLTFCDAIVPLDQTSYNIESS